MESTLIFLFLHNETLETRKYIIFKIALKHLYSDLLPILTCLKLSSTAQRFYWQLLESLSAGMLLIPSCEYCFHWCNKKKITWYPPFKYNSYYKFCVLLSFMAKNFPLKDAKFLWEFKCDSDESNVWGGLWPPHFSRLSRRLAFWYRRTPEHVLLVGSFP